MINVAGLFNIQDSMETSFGNTRDDSSMVSSQKGKIREDPLNDSFEEYVKNNKRSTQKSDNR